MPIRKEGDYLLTHDLGITTSIGIETKKLNDCINEIKTKNYLGCFGYPGFGFDQENLDFFSLIPEMIQIWFWDIKLKNIDGVYSLRNLKYFGMQDKRPKIDFSVFQNLEYMAWTPIKNDIGINKLTNLKRLDVWRWKSNTKTFTEMYLPEQLETLELNWCNPESLDELQPLNNLKELQIHMSRNLKNINGLVDKFPNIERLIINNCPHLDIENNGQFNHLKHVFINNKIRITTAST